MGAVVKWVQAGTDIWWALDSNGDQVCSVTKNGPDKPADYTLQHGSDKMAYGTLDAAKKAAERHVAQAEKNRAKDRQKKGRSTMMVDRTKLELVKENEALKAKFAALEANPPEGAQAMVGELTLEGYRQVWTLLHLAAVLSGPADKISPMDVEAMNNVLRDKGGIPATLLTPATGGMQLPVMTAEDIIALVATVAPIITKVAAGDADIPTKTRQFRDAVMNALPRAPIRIDPTHPNPPASTKAQIVAGKLLERPELAEEVLRLLMAGVGR
jgi:hypothetical protein